MTHNEQNKHRKQNKKASLKTGIQGNQSQAPPSNEQQIPAHQKQERSAINSLVAQPTSDEKQWRNEQKGYWERQIRVSTWLNGITIIGSIIALGALGAVFIQTRIAGTATQVAIDQLAVTQDVAKRQLRAYVSIDLAKMENPVCGGCVPSAVITLKNYGQTPAYRWQGWHQVMIGETFDEEHWNVTNPAALPQGGGTKGILGPGRTTDFEVRNDRLRLTLHQVQALAEGRLTLFVFGYIRYWDAFDRQQWTTYRYIYGGPVGLGKSFPQAPEGNDAS